MKVLVLSFLVIFLSYSSGNQHYCGRILSDTLSYMCEQENMVKRALHNYGFQGNRGQSPLLTQGYRDGESPVLSEGNGNHLSVDVQSMKLGGSRRQEFSWPWFGQQQALALSSIRGKRQGIADECCLKSCSLDELLSYC